MPAGNGAVCSIPIPFAAIALSQNHRAPSGETSQACTSEATVIWLDGSPAFCAFRISGPSGAARVVHAI